MPPSSNRLDRFWPAVLGLFSALSLAGLVALARLPADPEKALALGFSASRLALMAALLGLALAWAGLALAARRPSRRAAWFETARRPRLWDAILLAAPLLALAAQALLAILWGLSQHGENYPYLAYAQRLQPLLDVLSLTGLLLFIWLVLLRRAGLSAAPAEGRVAVAIIWLVFGALAIFVAVTRIGVTPEATGSWGEPAVPFLEWQVLLAWLLGSLFLLAETRAPALFSRKRIDVFIGLAIWLGTAVLWLSQPVQPAYFATPPRPPNYQIYPYSDGLTYAQYAQSILIGDGFMGGDIPARPLYIVFLAGLHALAGQDYTRVIALQTLVLAVFPLSLYLLGKELGSRPLGLAAALLVTLRDLTSNQVAPFTNNLTYSKLYFSELPTALCLSLFTWQAVRWLNGVRRARQVPALGGYHALLAPLLAGGLLGLGILVRTQSAIVFPVALLAAWLAIKKPRIALRGSLLLLAGVVLAVTPWLWRNWRLTGGLVFDNPASQTMVLAQRYSGLNFEDVIPYLPGETDSQYSRRMLQIALDGIRRDPGQALHTIANHFLNNEIDNVLLLPLRNDLQSLTELWQPTRAFWQDWTGQPSPGQAILLAAYLGLLGLGLAACWQKAGWAGLLPLGINLGYNLWTGIFRSSGGRFLVPVDWTATIYFAAGLVTLSGGLLLLLSRTRQGMLNYLVTSQTLTPGAAPSPAQSGGRGSLDLPPTPSGTADGSPDTPLASTGGMGGIPDSLPHRSERWGRDGVRVCAFLLPALIIFTLGASLPLAEHIFPQRYPPTTREALLAHLSTASALSQSGLDAPTIQALAQAPGALVLRGRAIYPRYYAAGEGEPLSAKTGYSDMPQPRLVFFILGQTNSLVVLDLPQSPPFFPNAADVTLIGLPRKGYIQAQAILVETPSKSALYLMK